MNNPYHRCASGERMDCICCGSAKRDIFFEPDYVETFSRIVRCENCGFLYAYEQPSRGDISDLYEYYELTSQWEKGSDFYNQAIVSMVQKLIPPGGSILEIGCSYGKILNDLQKMGYYPQGVEASSQACNFIRRKYEFPVYEGLIEDFLNDNKTPQGFDLVIAANILEHLIDPYQILKLLDGRIKKGGYILIIVPDIALALLVGKIRKMTQKTDPYNTNNKVDGGLCAFIYPDHLYYFSRKTLGLLCRRVGWELVEQKHAPYVLSGTGNLLIKDSLKIVFYRLIQLMERLGVRSPILSYSQLLLARKSN